MLIICLLRNGFLVFVDNIVSWIANASKDKIYRFVDASRLRIDPVESGSL